MQCAQIFDRKDIIRRTHRIFGYLCFLHQCLHQSFGVGISRFKIFAQPHLNRRSVDLSGRFSKLSDVLRFRAKG